jgi:hypothetical protein
MEVASQSSIKLVELVWALRLCRAAADMEGVGAVGELPVLISLDQSEREIPRPDRSLTVRQPPGGTLNECRGGPATRPANRCLGDSDSPEP